MQSISLMLENEIISFMTACDWIQAEAPYLYKLYWGKVSSDVSGLSGGDQAAITAKLTKTQLATCVTLADKINAFFQNSAVATSDYLANVQDVLLGNATGLASTVSVAVESFADRSKIMAQSMSDLFSKSKAILDLYNDNELADIAAVIDDDRIVFGANMTNKDMKNALTLIEQFKRMFNNESVTTADYGSTVAKWRRF